MNPCPYCGTPMSNPRRAQCGATECSRLWRNQRQREFQARRKREDGVRYEDRFKVERTCECGTAIRTRHGATRCAPCAQRVQQRVAAVASAEAARQRAASRKQLVPHVGSVRRSETVAFRAALAKLHLAAAGSRSRNAIYVGARCRRCGSDFVVMRTNDLPQWCSRSCARSEAKAIRRARQRGGAVVRYSRRAIFERDRWACQLCGKRVKRRAKVPDPKAPVIDHIVPLAAGPEVGGVDAPWNVQCAHFLCNSIKSASFAQPALALEVA